MGIGSIVAFVTGLSGNVKLGAIVIIALGLGGVALHHQWYSDGYTAGDTHRAKIDEAERLAMVAANKKAADDAAKALFKVAEALSLKSLELDNAKAALDAAADAEPNRPDGFPASRVRRLNSIGKGAG